MTIAPLLRTELDLHSTEKAPENLLLTPLGERLSRGDEIVSFAEFYTSALPPKNQPLVPLCIELVNKINGELSEIQQHNISTAISPFYINLANQLDIPPEVLQQLLEKHNARFLVTRSFRGSAVRRACWQLTENRNGYPVGDYWNITPWWQCYFSTHTLDDSAAKIEHAVQQILVNGPNDLDIRIEYPRVEDRTIYAPFAYKKLPKIIEQILLEYPSLRYSHNQFTEGVDPASDDGFRFTTYIGNLFKIFDPQGQTPLLTIDLGTTNSLRNKVYAAHNYGELRLLFDEEGVNLPKDEFNRWLITRFFSSTKISWFTAMHGLKGVDIIVRGTRQMLFGVFHDSGLPVYETFSYKKKYPVSDEKRIPEIAANCIVGLTADPLYVLFCLRLADYFRQFPCFSFLADDPHKQVALENTIIRRMTPDHFIDKVWDPFVIVDAYNEIGGNIERTFSGLVRLFTP